MAKGIGESCVRDVATVDRDTSVAGVAVSMRERHVGSVIVVDDRDGVTIPVGVVTDRDIVVGVVAAGLDPAAVTAGELVQRPVTTVPADADYVETVRLMAVAGVRRLPVVDAAGGLVGIVAVDDVLRALAAPLTALADLATREIRYEAATRR